jgi:type VI secretion system protein ImpK
MDDFISRICNLASCYQESFTAVLRVRSQRQTVQNAESFRQQIRAALRSAMDQARGLGYSSEIIQASLFSVVAFLDESILNLQNPAFADWSRQPLQEELFGGHTAGEEFFRKLQDLVGRQDSVEIADCLEVYCLCILLGFKGRYAFSGGGDLHSFVRQIRDKIARIRGNSIFLRPGAPLPEVESVAKTDRLSRVLAIVAICLLIFAVVVFGIFSVSLSSGASQVQNSSLNAL